MLPSVVLQEPGEVGHRKSTKLSSMSVSTPCIGSMTRTTSKSNDGWTTMLSPLGKNIGQQYCWCSLMLVDAS